MGFEPSPPSLLRITAEYCAKHLDTISTENCKLKPGISLPTVICQLLLEVTDKEKEQFEQKFVPIFKDTLATPLQHLHLRNAKITSAGLITLLRHRPLTINIHQCGRLTAETLTHINQYSTNLSSLTIGTSTQIFPEVLSSESTLINEQTKQLMEGGIIKANHLHHLSLHLYTTHFEVWKCMVSAWDQLSKLNLTGCDGLEDFKCLEKAVNLDSLCLYNVTIKDDGWKVITSFKKLRHLDVSTSSEISSIYSNSSAILSNLITNLTHLTSLDISGTNLAGRGVAESDQNCDIPGLETRVNCPLEFLGLYGAHHEASHRRDIPARKITGDKNEEQVLAACAVYLDRSELLEKILNDLFHLHRADDNQQSHDSVELILEAMNRHIGEKHVQISGSATLFYIVRNGDRSKINFVLRKEILSTLIRAMEIHIQDSTMMRNGCLTICLFRVPQDVLFAYKTLVSIILQVLSGDAQDEFVERISIYLLNSLACQVEGKEKVLVGEMGAIERMLNLIRLRLVRHECDDVMEIAWSTMWNVTDETPENCQRFLNGDGMVLFLSSLRAFPDKAELLRNMMGLLGNVAECSELRPRLMNDDFIKVFKELLDSTQDNIEVSYNAAGVLSHILSDGELSWAVDIPRESVTNKLESSILRWDVDSSRNINYRSFAPILRLLTVEISVCQLWASWALANLTKVYPDKYCELLRDENGLALLNPLLEGKGHVSTYANIAYKNVLDRNRILNNNLN